MLLIAILQVATAFKTNHIWYICGVVDETDLTLYTMKTTLILLSSAVIATGVCAQNTENGQVVIVKDGEKYNLAGIKL